MTGLPGKSIEYQPSETAIATTALRALAAKDEREEIQAGIAMPKGLTYYYLSSGVVDDILATIRAISAAGSSICFDYASISLEALNDEGVKKLREYMKSGYPAEPARFGIQKGKIEDFFAERGYEIIENLSSADMEARYLTLRDGTTAGKVPGLFALVHAAVSA